MKHDLNINTTSTESCSCNWRKLKWQEMWPNIVIGKIKRHLQKKEATLYEIQSWINEFGGNKSIPANFLSRHIKISRFWYERKWKEKRVTLENLIKKSRSMSETSALATVMKYTVPLIDSLRKRKKSKTYFLQGKVWHCKKHICASLLQYLFEMQLNESQKSAYNSWIVGPLHKAVFRILTWGQRSL